MKGSSAATLNGRLCLKPTSSWNTCRAKEGMLRTYLKVMNFLLQTNASEDVVAKTAATLTRYTQLSTILPTQYAKTLVSKSLRCGEYDQCILTGCLIEALHISVSYSLRSCWSMQPGSTLYNLPCQATSLRALKRKPKSLRKRV